MNGLNISHHAAARAVGRSIRQEDLQTLLNEGEWAESRRGGTNAVRLLRRDIPDAVARGIPRDGLERAVRLTAIVSEHGTVLTTYRRRRRCRGRQAVRALGKGMN